MPDPVPSGLPDLPPAGWSRGERLALLALVLALAALMVTRGLTRRPDSARTPLQPDILVIHAAGLRSDAATQQALANDLDFDPAAMALFVNAFAQGTSADRSARCALDGDLVRDLGARAAPISLPRRLGERGWRTLLLDDSRALHDRIGGVFDVSEPVAEAEQAPAVLAPLWASAPGPVFAFVHLGFGAEPLHSDTTEAYVLQERYRLRLRRIRAVVRDVARAARRDRPQLVVLIGASGLPLGEHPEAPDLPFDELLHVPWLMGLRGADGLPTGTFPELVQGADLAPTVLDLVDARTLTEMADDGGLAVGRSLEPHLHGWATGPVHSTLVLFGVGHVAVRSTDWKLIAPTDASLAVQGSGARLFSLREDPEERRDLLIGREHGPVADALLRTLNDRFGAPAPSR